MSAQRNRDSLERQERKTCGSCRLDGARPSLSFDSSVVPPRRRRKQRGQLNAIDSLAPLAVEMREVTVSTEKDFSEELKTAESGAGSRRVIMGFTARSNRAKSKQIP